MNHFVVIENILLIDRMFHFQPVLFSWKFNNGGIMVKMNERNSIVEESMMVWTQHQHIGMNVQAVMVATKGTEMMDLRIICMRTDLELRAANLAGILVEFFQFF